MKDSDSEFHRLKIWDAKCRSCAKFQNRENFQIRNFSSDLNMLALKKAKEEEINFTKKAEPTVTKKLI